MKHFSGALVNQGVNCHLPGLCNLQKRCLKNFNSIRDGMTPEIVDKNVFEIVTILNNLVLICRLVI